MHRSANYQQPSGTRSSSNHSTSSAFSANANPNEDWTKISDLAERRRIQNRIAQRNYRKKLKRRLEDLEKRAASASASPELSHEKMEPPKTTHAVKPRTKHYRTSKSNSDVNSHTSAERTPFYAAQDDRGTMFSHQCTRQLSASPPPVFSTYPSYSHLDPYGQSTYGQSTYGQPHVYNSLSGSYSEMSYHGEYGSTLPSLLPVTIGTAAPMKRHHAYADEDIISPFNMSYATMAGIDLCPTSQQLAEHNLSIPPLSQMYSDDHSSPSACPPTPESDRAHSPHSYHLM